MSAIRTFIVEDSPIIREGLVEALEEATDVQVVGTAADENAALEWLKLTPSGCDLMIIDIFLKGGSGLGVLRRVADEDLQAKRVVLTNYATDDMRRTCKALGADRVFDKSRELEELIAYCARLSDGDDSRPGDLR